MQREGPNGTEGERDVVLRRAQGAIGQQLAHECRRRHAAPVVAKRHEHAGLGLVQVGRNNLSCQTASGWMVGKSGMEIRERVRGVLEECLRSLARKKTSTELASHWSGFGQLFDAEAGSVLARLGMEFIGFLPGREGS